MFSTTSWRRWLRPAAVRVALATGLAVACAAGTAVAVAVAPASSAAPVRAASSRAVALPKVSHQLCYAAEGKYQIPPRIELLNQFSPKGFVPKIGAVAIHCNPVVKILPNGKTFGITNPKAHLLCFNMTPASPQPTPEVLVTNQFGSAALIPGQPNLLCLPSWKSLTGPPKQKPAQPPGLSHFTCYPVQVAPGTAGFTNVPKFVYLRDEFAAKPVRAVVSPVPAELCLPTVKVVDGKVYKIANPTTHLLCFPVSQTPTRPRVWDQNQFGTSVVYIGNTRWLCLPSTKQILVPVDHQLCYTAQGKYPIPPKIELFNQFSPKGFVPRIGTVAIHCNPVVKTLPDGGQSFPITNPQAHLLCFTMTAAATQPTPVVVVTNQFGSATLATGQPNLLCLPSWKSLKAPPNEKVSQPPGLSHFTCYPVKELPGTAGGYAPPPGLLLQDEFAPKPVAVRVSAVPAELCLPTEKVVNGKVYKIVNPVTHLLCFRVTQTPIVPRVWDENQFGTSQILIGTTRWLCLPSTKQIVSSTSG
jgi:hypothetical protein